MDKKKNFGFLFCECICIYFIRYVFFLLLKSDERENIKNNFVFKYSSKVYVIRN